jgi:hypothetical protein
VRRRTAKASVYALTVHSSCASDAPRFGLDHRQGGGHDEVVERGHEQRERGDDERPERGAACGHWIPFRCLPVWIVSTH